MWKLKTKYLRAQESLKDVTTAIEKTLKAIVYEKEVKERIKRRKTLSSR